MRLVGTLASPMVALGEQDGGDPRVPTHRPRHLRFHG